MTRETLNRSLKDAATLLHSQLAHLKKLKVQREEDNQTLTKLISEVTEASYQHARKSETVQQLTTQIERAQQARLSSSEITEFALQEAERRDYQDKLCCGLCRRHEKDTVLTKCWHVFCSGCVERILAKSSAERRCPRCGTPFGKSDFSKVFF